MQRLTQKNSASRPARFAYSLSILALSVSLAACGGTATTEEPAADAGSGVSGDIQIDGSSTVFPISEAMAEEFQIANPDTRVTVGVSGSGGGFKKFCAGETDISNASRPIKEEEVALCDEAGIEFIEVPIAYDGITLVTNPENDWAQCLTVDQLNAMWSPEAEGSVENWNQVDPSFPDEPLELFGPGTDSGTFDYFTDEVNGEEGASRGDYTASEDDNVIVTGVESTSGGLGYFGYAYYEENQDQLKSIEVENEAGECIAPSRETIADGSYNPMSRPLYFYVKKEAYDTKPQVKAFVDYQLSTENGELVQEAGYITLPDDALAQAKSRVEEGKLGKDPI
ncbi:PstS family phosphate ABC transporter substrate-binding protein [cf. Phormidesmis sp. LEGE 11477]|uniref:PstS family phosphate ABC transporter substrate-binding protein n=1 Tax=cf. Phormidesmis sp. LEGE 11477 TaxID=1828680 RepID=UPI001881B567|nr:PstS family phosphate ABC transporter substrate-binding protein [cf. Phormidesmis sp. LEGE 11477]MBE9064194.1 PstS family phosphate ABC transporter substrate-binding protein [cf. Phormidesmis sp. LEGE 11477]